VYAWNHELYSFYRTDSVYSWSLLRCESFFVFISAFVCNRVVVWLTISSLMVLFWHCLLLLTLAYQVDLSRQFVNVGFWQCFCCLWEFCLICYYSYYSIMLIYTLTARVSLNIKDWWCYQLISHFCLKYHSVNRTSTLNSVTFTLTM